MNDAPAQTPKRILVEGRNVVLQRGTGIATYCRELAAVHQALGYQSDVLFQADFSVHPKRPNLNEIELYDFEARKANPRFAPLRWARFAKPFVTDWFGVRPGRVANTGLIADSSTFFGLKSFDRRYAVRDLFIRANKHFMISNRFLNIQPQERPDLFHVTHPASIRIPNCPNIYTVHDLVPLRLPHATLDHKRLFMRTLKMIAKTADHVVTVSEQTRKDMIHFIGIDEDRITNTYQSADFPDHLVKRGPEETQRDLEFLKLEPENYFLFLGTLEPKKNIKRLLDAFLSSGSKRKLVVAGPHGWSSDEELGRILSGDMMHYRFQARNIHLERPIIHLSYVPLHLLVSLLRHARALLFPSLYEGFGLPVLEAMKEGTPVLTSKTSSLPEVAGDAAVLVDPYSVIEISRGITSLDKDDALCKELKQKGLKQAELFSRERYQERMTAVYNKFV